MHCESSEMMPRGRRNASVSHTHPSIESLMNLKVSDSIQNFTRPTMVLWRGYPLAGTRTLAPTHIASALGFNFVPLQYSLLTTTFNVK